MLPLISITSLNLLLCLLQRSVHECMEGTNSSCHGKESDVVDVEGSDGKSNEDELKEVLYSTYGTKIIPALLIVIKKLVSYSHMYICRSILETDENLAQEMEDVIKDLISISSTKAYFKKSVGKPMFASHIPDSVLDRLKSWNASLCLDSSQIEKVCLSQIDKINLLDEFSSLLTLSMNSFASHRTFDPTRLLKTTLTTALTLLLSFLNLCTQEQAAEFLKDVIPFATDLAVEFAIDSDGNKSDIVEKPLYQIASLFDTEIFTRQCTLHKVYFKHSFIHLVFF